jgi:hypothetical protein
MVVSTRFSAKPDFGNSFNNFQHAENSSGYLSERVRFAGQNPSFLKLKKVFDKDQE